MIREQKQQFNKRIIEKGSTYAKFFSQNEMICYIFKRVASKNLICKNCGEIIKKGQDYYRLQIYSQIKLCENCSPIKLQKARGNKENGEFKYYND